MLRLASDADVHGDIIRGILRRVPAVDLIRVQDVLAEGVHDREILDWAAAENRVLLTHDRNTMVGFAIARIAAGEPMPGLVVTTTRQSLGSAIDEILLITELMSEDEMRSQAVIYLPF